MDNNNNGDKMNHNVDNSKIYELALEILPLITRRLNSGETQFLIEDLVKDACGQTPSEFEKKNLESQSVHSNLLLSKITSILEKMITDNFPNKKVSSVNRWGSSQKIIIQNI